MGFAPAVSIEYWQELSMRHANYLENHNELESAAIAHLVANNCDQAIDLMT